MSYFISFAGGLFYLPGQLPCVALFPCQRKSMQGRKKNATVGLTGASVAKEVSVQPARGESKVESDRVDVAL